MITKGFGANQKIMTIGFGGKINLIIRHEVIRLQSIITNVFSIVGKIWK